MRRRLLRILLNAATGLSLVLCVLTVAAWVRSYRARDVVLYWPNPHLVLNFGTYRGGFTAGVVSDTRRYSGEYSAPPGMGWEQHAPVNLVPGPDATFYDRLGFEFLHSEEPGVWTSRDVDLPYWFIVLLTAILPAARLAGWRRHARRLRMRPGLCQHCGYDCRATPERCPECGTALVMAATRAREGKGETEGV